MKQNLVVVEGMLAHIMANGSGFLHSDAGKQVYLASRVIEDLNVLPGDELKCWCFYNDPEHAHTAEYKAIRVMVTKRIDPSMAPKPKEQTPVSIPAPAPEPAPAAANGNDGPFAALADIPLPEKIVAPLRKPVPPPAKAMAAAPSEARQVASPDPAPTKVAPEATAPVQRPAEATADWMLDGDELFRIVDDILNLPRLFSIKDIYIEICRRDPRQWKDDKLNWRITHAAVSMAEKGKIATAKLYSSTEQTNASAVLYARNLDLMLMLMKGETK